MKQFVRLIVVALFAGYALVAGVPDIVAPWYPWGSYGFDASADGRITNVYPGLPAARAGIKAGDRIDIQHADLEVVRVTSALSLRAPGTTAVFPIVDASGNRRNVTLTAAPFPRAAIDNITDIIAIVAYLVFLGIATVLVLRRPSWLTWAFFLFACGSTTNSAWFLGGIPTSWYVASRFTMPLLGFGWALCGFAVFAAIFPAERPIGWRRTVAIALVALNACVVLLRLVDRSLVSFGSAHALSPAVSANLLLSSNYAFYLGGVVLFAVNYMTASASERLRLRWVILGFAVGYSGLLINKSAQLLPAIAVTPPIWVVNCLSTLTVLAPASVAYAITKHRVIDIRFFVSRALVYSVITGAAVVTLVLFEVLVAKQLEQYHLDVVVEIFGALLLGIGIHRIHGIVDRFVDRVVFRSVHAAQAHLESIGEAMMYARSVHAIDEMLHDETIRALDLEDVRITHHIDDDDQLAMRLQATRHPIDAGDWVAIPFLIRHQLYGYARFGHHRNGSAIDPTERTILSHLCHRAAVAYDHVTSEERAAENQRLAMDLAVLQAKYDEVKSIVRATP